VHLQVQPVAPLSAVPGRAVVAVGFAGISGSVFVGIELVRIRHLDAVVDGVGDAVPVAVRSALQHRIELCAKPRQRAPFRFGQIAPTEKVVPLVGIFLEVVELRVLAIAPEELVTRVSHDLMMASVGRLAVRSEVFGIDERSARGPRRHLEKRQDAHRIRRRRLDLRDLGHGCEDVHGVDERRALAAASGRRDA